MAERKVATLQEYLQREQQLELEPKEIGKILPKSVDDVDITVEIENFVEIASAKSVKLRLKVQTSVSDAFKKISRKGGITIILSNYSYGEANYELVLGGKALNWANSLKDEGIKDGDVIHLRPKVLESVTLYIQIEDFAKLGTPNRVL